MGNEVAAQSTTTLAALIPHLVPHMHEALRRVPVQWGGSVRWTEEQLDEYQRGRAVRQPAPAPAKKKRTKFGNIRCQSSDGKNFGSKLERDYYEQLLLCWKAGEVLWFVRQPRFDLEGGVVYVADFLVVDSRGDVSVIDTKGHMTPECRNKLKQVKARWGIEVKLVRSV